MTPEPACVLSSVPVLTPSAPARVSRTTTPITAWRPTLSFTGAARRGGLGRCGMAAALGVGPALDQGQLVIRRGLGLEERTATELTHRTGRAGCAPAHPLLKVGAGDGVGSVSGVDACWA